MNYYTHNNFIVLHGGKDDKSDKFYDDTFILTMNNLNWI